MSMTRLLLLFALMGVGLAGLAGLRFSESTVVAREEKKVEGRVFEMRTYYAAPGKMKALHARFRDHTNTLFKKHGMEIIGFWSPIDPTEAEKKLVYILAYPSKEAATQSWKAFQADPDWKKAKDASEVGGKLVDKVDSVFLTGTDYSPIK
jgi:NIPSNAP